MAQTKPITIRYNGLFDFNGFYSAVIDWCKNYGFEWQEETYKHKVPSPKGAEQEWMWFAEKEVTAYYKYKIMIIIHAWDMKDFDIEIKGKKKEMTNARIEIVMIGFLTTDWQKKWGKSKFTKFLGRAYEKIYRRELESVWWDTLYYRMWNLHAVMKKYFDMQTKSHEYKDYLNED